MEAEILDMIISERGPIAALVLVVLLALMDRRRRPVTEASCSERCGRIEKRLGGLERDDSGPSS